MGKIDIEKVIESKFFREMSLKERTTWLGILLIMTDGDPNVGFSDDVIDFRHKVFPGDTSITDEEIQQAISYLEAWGLIVLVKDDNDSPDYFDNFPSYYEIYHPEFYLED